MSGGGSRRAGWTSCAAEPLALIGGAVQTTANTTAAGLRIANTNIPAKKSRNTRERRAPPTALFPSLFVRKIFKFGGQLTNPSAVVQPADEASIALVSSDIEKLLLCDQRPKAGKVGIRAVAHDAADHAGELAPLALGKGLAVASDRDQQGRGGARDRIREDLLRLRTGNDLAPGADDVRDPVPAYADDVAAA